MESLLVGVQPTDPANICREAAGLALLMTVLGALIPALRAIRIDPASALRGRSALLSRTQTALARVRHELRNSPL